MSKCIPDPFSTEKPVLLEAINLTFRTLERRLRLYRNLVIAVSLTGLGSVIVAGILRCWVVLVGELALPVYFAGFLLFDRHGLAAGRISNARRTRTKRRATNTKLDGASAPASSDAEFDAFGFGH